MSSLDLFVAQIEKLGRISVKPLSPNKLTGTLELADRSCLNWTLSYRSDVLTVVTADFWESLRAPGTNQTYFICLADEANEARRAAEGMGAFLEKFYG